MRFVRKWEGNYHYDYTDADAFTIAGQAIPQKWAIFEIIKDSPFLQKKTPAHAGVGWLEAVPGVEHGDKGLAGPTP